MRTYAISAIKIAEVKTRYEVGRYIFEDEQQGERAKYGEQVLQQLSARLMERYGADWTYDTLKRCRFFYQSYANASIGATPLPQLENHVETSDSKEVTNCGNGVATIQYFDFPFLQVPLAKLQEDEILQVALAENTQTPILQVPLAPTIGLLLCPTKSNEKVRFSLRGFSQHSNNPGNVWKIEK